MFKQCVGFEQFTFRFLCFKVVLGGNFYNKADFEVRNNW